MFHLYADEQVDLDLQVKKLQLHRKPTAALSGEYLRRFLKNPVTIEIDRQGNFNRCSSVVVLVIVRF